MFIGNIKNGIVTWTASNIEQHHHSMFQVGYLPTNRIIPADRRWLEQWHGIRSRIAVVTPSWGVAGSFQWRKEELNWFGVKKTPVIVSTTLLVNQPVIVLWDRPEQLDGSDSIRIIR